MKYEYVKKPSLKGKEVARQKYKLNDDTFIIGWEIGKWETGEENQPQWVHIREVFS